MLTDIKLEMKTAYLGIKLGHPL